jgi:hypothetical protein
MRTQNEREIHLMKRLHSFRPLLAVLFLCMALAPSNAKEEKWQVPLTPGKDGWMVYKNVRFGSVLPVPPGMVAQRPPDNGGGQSFTTADGKVTLLVFGSFNVDGNGDLDARWKDALAEPDRTITYKRKAEGWYVISGVNKDGTGFYERYDANSKYCAGWEMTYPQELEKKYAPWIERIAKGYEPRLGKGEDTVP